MARKTSPRIAPTASPRHFWLAGLGFVSIASRRAVSTAGTAADRAVRARQDVMAAMQKARSRATAATTELRDRIDVAFPTCATEANNRLESSVMASIRLFQNIMAEESASTKQQNLAAMITNATEFINAMRELGIRVA